MVSSTNGGTSTLTGIVASVTDQKQETTTAVADEIAYTTGSNPSNTGQADEVELTTDGKTISWLDETLQIPNVVTSKSFGCITGMNFSHFDLVSGRTLDMTYRWLVLSGRIGEGFNMGWCTDSENDALLGPRSRIYCSYLTYISMQSLDPLYSFSKNIRICKEL